MSCRACKPGKECESCEVQIPLPLDDLKAVTTLQGMSPDRTRVYVAGAYSKPVGQELINTRRAIEVGQQLLEAGLAPMVPHLSHWWHTEFAPNSWEDWLELDLAWITVADCLLRLPGESPGADVEVAWATACGVPVFYSLEDTIHYHKIMHTTRKKEASLGH